MKQVSLRRQRQIVLSALSLAVLLTSSGWPVPDLSQRFSKIPHTYGSLEYYHPKKREGLFSVARRFGVSLRMLSQANRSRNSGSSLLIPTLFFPPKGAPNEVVINLAERAAYRYDAAGQPAQVYPVAIGRTGWETPTGNFRVVQKRKNPTWFPPAWAKLEEPVPPGPQNPLGDRWIGLSVPGYGMHATNAPTSVGRAVSHGCMRMYPEDVRELFDKVKVGTRVRITYETLLLGYSPADHAVYLAVHPDIYSKGTNKLSWAKDLLNKAGLAAFIDDTQLTRLLKETSGLPVSVLGSGIKLTVNGTEVALPIGPTPRNGDYLVPARPLMDALGASLGKTPQDNWYIFWRGGNRLSFIPGQPDAWVNDRTAKLKVAPLLLRSNRQATHDMLFLPLHVVCTALGDSLNYDVQTKTLQITDGVVWREQQLGPPTSLPATCNPANNPLGCASPAPELLPPLGHQ